MFALEGLEEALQTLGAVLESRQIESRILVAGGSSLLLLGVVKRPKETSVVGLVDDNHYVKAERIPSPLAARFVKSARRSVCRSSGSTTGRLRCSTSVCRTTSRTGSRYGAMDHSRFTLSAGTT